MFKRREPKHTLLSLPAEIRERIFIFAVTSSKPVVTFCLDPFQRDSFDEAFQPPVTYVSRQVRKETLPLFYESNAFILHTRGSKSEDAQRWLRCYRDHLPKLACLELWTRYIPPNGDLSVASGALSMSIRHNARTGLWQADPDWRWVTVVRRPADLGQDGDSLLGHLEGMMAGKSRATMDVEDYCRLLLNLRDTYFLKKLDGRSQ